MIRCPCGIPLTRMGGHAEEQLATVKVILWKGHCSVHQMFQAEHVHQFRKQHPGIKILVHPECPQEVNDLADVSGSTGKIIATVEASPPGTKWAIGTELHLVNRLKQEHPGAGNSLPVARRLHVRHDVPHRSGTSLLESRESGGGTPVNRIDVDEETAKWSLVALERMLEVV